MISRALHILFQSPWRTALVCLAILTLVDCGICVVLRGLAKWRNVLDEQDAAMLEDPLDISNYVGFAEKTGSPKIYPINYAKAYQERRSIHG
jgi:hypothetical protein